MLFLFENNSLAKVIYLLIRCNKTKYSLWNWNNTDRNGVNKRNTPPPPPPPHTHTHNHHTRTHTKQSKKNDTGKGWSEGSNFELGFLWIFVFFVVQKKYTMTSPSGTWYLSLHKKQLLFEKILHVNKLWVRKVSLNVPEFFQGRKLSRAWKKAPAFSKIHCGY